MELYEALQVYGHAEWIKSRKNLGQISDQFPDEPLKIGAKKNFFWYTLAKIELTVGHNNTPVNAMPHMGLLVHHSIGTITHTHTKKPFLIVILGYMYAFSLPMIFVPCTLYACRSHLYTSTSKL